MSIVEKVVAWLAQQDMPVYLVGGSVRDPLLGRRLYDLDVAIAGDGLVLARRLANHFGGAYYPLDEVRSTGRALLPGQGDERLMVDIAQLRGPCLDADLADRDFTVNALAVDARAPDEIIDQHGGLSDLAAGLIRPVGQDAVRNDPLRALRAVRLAASLGFTLAPETQALVRRDGAGLRDVSGERIRDELARLLANPHAAGYLLQLDELGLLAVLLPELEPLHGMEQSLPHRLDGFAHSMATVRTLESLLADAPVVGAGLPDELACFVDRLEAHVRRNLGEVRPRLVTLKLAALLHDTGKPVTRSLDEDGRIRFLGHERESARIVSLVLRRLRFNKDEVHLGETVVRHHLRPLLLAQQDRVSTRAVYRFFRDTRDAGVDVLLHSLADYCAIHALEAAGVPEPQPPGEGWERLVALAARMLVDYYEYQSDRVDPPRIVGGRDLMREFGLEPGPHIGEYLEAVREAQVSGEVATRQEALAVVGQLVQGGA